MLICFSFHWSTVLDTKNNNRVGSYGLSPDLYSIRHTHLQFGFLFLWKVKNSAGQQP